MSLQNDLQELLRAEIINQDTADKISVYYRNKDSKKTTSSLLIVFAIVGAILVGLGIILIFAHNWDNLSTVVKTSLAFLPMLLGQILCGLAIIKWKENVAWREGAATYLFFAVGASISLVSQIYNIPGNLSSFLLTWMLLILPLIYLMKSSNTSLLYIAGLTFYTMETEYWSMPHFESLLYYILLILVLPHYYFLYKDNQKSNFLIYHNWIIPLSLIVTLGINADKYAEIMYIAYFSLFAILFLFGDNERFSNSKIFANAYRFLGEIGTIFLLMVLSFDDFWVFIREMDSHFYELIFARELIVSIILTIIASFLLYKKIRKNNISELNSISFIFLLFILIYITGMFAPLSTPLINLMILGIGVNKIRNAAKNNSLGGLNYGLLIISILIICRFFDTDLSFIIRGTLFVMVGLGFFAANYWMIKNRGNK